jgi:carboxylesterase type B
MGLMQSSVRTLATTEDCLRLSITRPEVIAPGEQRPVMVWIHGGSYVFGAGDAAITTRAHWWKSRTSSSFRSPIVWG